MAFLLKHWAKTLPWMVFFFVTACSPMKAPPVSITQAITDIADDLGKFRTLGVMDVTLWTDTQREDFAHALHVEQCRQKTPDPVIVMLRDNLLVKLTGSISSTGGFTVGSNGSGLPSVGLSGSKSHGQDQELDVPIYMTPLSLLPDYTYLQQKDRYKAVWSERDPARGQTYGESLMQSHTLLLNMVQDVMAAYVTDGCEAKVGKNPAVLFGTKRPQ